MHVCVPPKPTFFFPPKTDFIHYTYIAGKWYANHINRNAHFSIHRLDSEQTLSKFACT